MCTQLQDTLQLLPIPSDPELRARQQRSPTKLLSAISAKSKLHALAICVPLTTATAEELPPSNHQN